MDDEFNHNDEVCTSLIYLICSYWNFIENDVIDILQDHHMHNIQAEELPSQPEDLNNPDESLNNNEADESSTQRAHCYSKTPRDAQPKSMTMK